jgi:hypothetical protein
MRPLWDTPWEGERVGHPEARKPGPPRAAPLFVATGDYVTSVYEYLPSRLSHKHGQGEGGDFFCLPWRALSWQEVTQDVATALPVCPETPPPLSHASYCPHQASRRDAGEWYGSGGAALAH